MIQFSLDELKEIEAVVSGDLKLKLQKEIRKDVALTVGTRKVKIIAEDMNGNVESFEIYYFSMNLDLNYFHYLN